MKLLALCKLLLAASVLLLLVCRPFWQLPQSHCYLCWKWHIYCVVSFEFDHCIALSCRQFEVDNL